MENQEHNIIKFGKYVVYNDNGKKRPIKKVNTPGSRFSKAKFLTGEIPKDFKIEIQPGSGSWGLYYVWENKFIIPTTVYNELIIQPKS